VEVSNLIHPTWRLCWGS